MAKQTFIREDIVGGSRPKSEFKAERKFVQAALEELVPRIGLAHYTVRWRFCQSIAEVESTDAFIAASIDTDYETMTLYIKVNEKLFTAEPCVRFGSEGQKSTLFHELVHAVTDEHLVRHLADIVDLLDVSDEVKGMLAKKVDEGHERLARTITRAFYGQVAV